MSHRTQTQPEEIANSLSHGIGLIAAMVAAPMLIVASLRQGNGALVVGTVIFSVTMVLVYLTSMLYHAVSECRWRERLLQLDHGAIPLFMAGSYTPFALGAGVGLWGWLLFGGVWLLAVGGLVLRAMGLLRRPLYSTGLYLLMGWLVLVAAWSLAAHLTPDSLAWLVAGGVAYTVGVLFFALDAHVRFGHFIWHLFVMTGSTCHVLAVMSVATR
ncbi:hemolysin III [Chitinimonas prasina]|uniref:Hemolysin III n=1 Tax=Chitinimonas prasina TaxID=1434937 RepID=A0ABQ5YIB4_9NEIS|nr:hemolysin III family protein [Chitinimonas prasina]GLR13728.1 hemolysin III [Chitinimonas prasina]